MSVVTGLFFLILLLNQRWSPPLRLQASHCSTFRIMCDVPSKAVFCSESIEWFPGTASKFFLKLLVTIPVAPIIAGIIVHFSFHIRCISIHKLLYFKFFSASFCTTFRSAVIATTISFIIIIIKKVLVSYFARRHVYKNIYLGNFNNKYSSFISASMKQVKIRDVRFSQRCWWNLQSIKRNSVTSQKAWVFKLLMAWRALWNSPRQPVGIYGHPPL